MCYHLLCWPSPSPVSTSADRHPSGIALTTSLRAQKAPKSRSKTPASSARYKRLISQVARNHTHANCRGVSGEFLYRQLERHRTHNAQALPSGAVDAGSTRPPGSSTAARSPGSPAPLLWPIVRQLTWARSPECSLRIKQHLLQNFQEMPVITVNEVSSVRNACAALRSYQIAVA
jgi:hypothetical protein